MPLKDNSKSDRLTRIVDEARQNRRQREKGYRERALKMFPPVCGHCGREFSGKKLRELTVHHRDHDHDNNPPDGSNWELLCLYCHDNEHSRQQVAEWYEDDAAEDAPEDRLSHRPFAGLEDLLRKKDS